MGSRQLHVARNSMGGGVSFVNNPKYGEKLTIFDVKEICGGVLNEALFDCLKDHENLVNKEKFLKILSDSVEQEILFLYFHFTKSIMDLHAFILFCAHGKLLTKHSFRRKDAEALFQNYSQQQQGRIAINNEDQGGELKISTSTPRHGQSASGGINYMQLRFDIFPEIAMKKGIDLPVLLVKLSRLPPPNLQETSSSTNNQLQRSESGHSPTTQERIAKNIAATKIQKVQRTWLARNELAREKELHRLRSGKHSEKEGGGGNSDNQNATSPRGIASSYTHNQSFDHTEEEIKCHLMFSNYCNGAGEMDIKDFLRLCYDTELIPFDTVKIDFTSKDAKHIFNKVISKYFIPEENRYHEGVIHGKRVVYDVFRLRFIPEIAAIKNVGIDDIVSHIARSSGKARHHHGQSHGAGHGPPVISLLDQKHIDEKVAENTKHYGEHVE